MRTITHALLLTLCLVPLAVRAQKGHERRDKDQRREEIQRRVRTMRAISLANHLDLDEREALRLNHLMTEYDGRRHALREQIRGHMRILRNAADEPNPDGPSVDSAIDAVLQGRQQMETLHQEEARALMKNLNARQRARLALFLKKFPEEVRKAMKRHREKRRRHRRDEERRDEDR